MAGAPEQPPNGHASALGARRRRLAYAASGAAAVVLLGAWLALRPSRAAPPPNAAPAEKPAAAPARSSAHGRVLAPPLSSATAPARARHAPVIDQVLVEKSELCAGEETLVTLHAHTLDGTDSELHYSIGSGTGQSVPVRAWPDAQGNPPALQVTAFGKGNVATTLPLPALRIRPCKASRFVMLSHRSLPNRWGVFEFRAALREIGAEGSGARSVALRPRRYAWSFGDGTRDVTSDGELTHSYEDRPQQALYSQLLVRVEVTTSDGRTLIARDALQLQNPAYESWSRKGIVSLTAALDPAFPTLSATGRVEQGVRLRHFRPGPVVIESVRAVRYYTEGAGESPPESIDVVALLGTNTIPAGAGLELHVALDARAEPDVLSVNYYLRGRSAEGRPVIGSFSVMQPPPKPRAGNSTPVTDPHLLAKIRRARERLSKDVVSQEDLARLERQGELDDL